MSKKKKGARKQPKINQKIGNIKVAKLSHFKRDGQVYFSFCRFDGTRKWGAIEKNEAVNLWDIVTRIKGFETMTWEILRGDRTISHYPYENLSNECHEALLEIRMDEFDELWSLPLSGRKRLWGVRVDMFFLVLWYDPEHNVYQTN